MQESGGLDFTAVGLAAPICHQVNSKLTLREKNTNRTQ